MKDRGITLVALVVTISLMITLAAVTITGAINGGLFDYAGKAKKSAEVADETDIIKKATIFAKNNNKYGNLEESELQNQLDELMEEGKKATVVNANEEGFTIKFEDNNRYYEVDKNGNVTGPRTLEPVQYAGDITKGGTCTGTSTNPYKIECIEDLVKLSTMAANKQTNNNAKFYVLTKDLDFNSIFSYSNYRAKYSYDSETDCYIPDETSETTIKELCTTGQGFIPIGLDYNNGITFQGTFNGRYNNQNHKISNIYINRSSSAGLFGVGRNVIIKNLTIDGHIISTNATATGIIVQAYTCTLNKCYNKAKIEGKTGASGIFGYGGATITECGNEGEIIAQSGHAVGISRYSGTISKCYNAGNIRGEYASGIRGRADVSSTITNCFNCGNITSGTGVCTSSGITAWHSKGLYNCYNTGKITGACVSKGSSTYGIGRTLSDSYKLCYRC